MTLLIKYDTFPEYEAKFLFTESCLCINSIHEMNYIHRYAHMDYEMCIMIRDVKPDNFLIDKFGHLKLSDFGLCTGFRSQHKSTFYAGMCL